MTVLETARLSLRRLSLADAAFVLELVNDPDWIRFVGDRNVHSLADAEAYLANKLLPSYERHGFGLFLAELRGARTPVGIAGFVRRDELDDVDVGYALLPAFRGCGYARESVAGLVTYARESLGLRRLLAIVTSDNVRSIRVLEENGFKFERHVRLPADDEELALFALDSGSHASGEDPRAAAEAPAGRSPRARPGGADRGPPSPAAGGGP